MCTVELNTVQIQNKRSCNSSTGMAMFINVTSDILRVEEIRYAYKVESFCEHICNFQHKKSGIREKKHLSTDEDS